MAMAEMATLTTETWMLTADLLTSILMAKTDDDLPKMIQMM